MTFASFERLPSGLLVDRPGKCTRHLGRLYVQHNHSRTLTTEVAIAIRNQHPHRSDKKGARIKRAGPQVLEGVRVSRGASRNQTHAQSSSMS
jgi:hypothetical protein